MRAFSLWPLLLALLFAGCGGLGEPTALSPTPTPAAGAVPPPREIAVTLSTFKFEPSTITVKKGEPVQFALNNIEGIHTFTIAELNLDITLQEGQVARAPIVTPPREGEFRLVCRFHELSGMIGTMRVGDVTSLSSPVPTSQPALPSPTAPASAATPTLAPAPTPPALVPAPLSTVTLLAFQELGEIENYAASRFYPDRFVVLKGIPVRLHITRLHSEHVNRFSIEPFVRSTAFFRPGTIGVIEFTPDRTGEFRMRNEGHGYEASFTVVDSVQEARARSIEKGLQEFSLIHDFTSSSLSPRRFVVQQGVPVRIYNTGLGGEDRVSIAPFYLPTTTNVQAGKITVFEFTPQMAGEFPITYERSKITGTLVVEGKR